MPLRTPCSHVTDGSTVIAPPPTAAPTGVAAASGVDTRAARSGWRRVTASIGEAATDSAGGCFGSAAAAG